MKITLKNIYINDKNAKGVPYLNKNGEPFKMVNIVSDRENKASMYVGPKDTDKLLILETWKPGDTVDIEITKGEKFTNFNLPRVDETGF